MSEKDGAIQLKVWKDLAISKQVLMRATTEALGLTSECSTEELQSALERAIRRTNEADKKVAEMSEQTEKELASIKALLGKSEAALADARDEVDEAIKAREAMERQLAASKSENAKALKAVRAEVAENQRKLKTVSKILADTPENVVKKLKTLKKQKHDDAKIRAQIETRLRTTCKEKNDLERQVEAQSTRLEQVVPLLQKLREMHDSCSQANKKIKLLSGDNGDLAEVPTLDEGLLETLEKAMSDQESCSDE